jgi:hypothetical protein
MMSLVYTMDNSIGYFILLGNEELVFDVYISLGVCD